MSIILPLAELDRMASVVPFVSPHHAMAASHPHHHLHHTGYQVRPWINRALAVADLKHLDGAEKTSHVGKDGFQVSLDVQHFAPNEITVKTVKNSILVEAKHDERIDEHGHISRHFTRRYDLPKGFDVHDIVSQLSSDGILTLKAPPTQQEGAVRVVHIQHTGPAHLSINKDHGKKPTDAMVE